MKKVWIGPELEGDSKGVLTMFVKGNPRLEFLKDYFEDHPKCKRLYLGAGRTDTTKFPDDLLDYCDDHNIKVVIETSPAGLKYVPNDILYAYQIILRMDIPEAVILTKQDYMKLDTGKAVYIARLDQSHHTDLTTLSGDTFSVDKVIYEEDTK